MYLNKYIKKWFIFSFLVILEVLLLCIWSPSIKNMFGISVNTETNLVNNIFQYNNLTTWKNSSMQMKEVCIVFRKSIHVRYMTSFNTVCRYRIYFFFTVRELCKEEVIKRFIIDMLNQIRFMIHLSRIILSV